MRRHGWGGLWLLALLAGAAGTTFPPQVLAQAASQSGPVGVPKPGQALRDPDFGVVTRQFGLERTVEMYQWHRAGEGYFAGWSLEPVDSTGFKPGYDNPGAFPLASNQWRDLKVTLDGKPLALDAATRLGEWRAFRPDFSALPGNLAASFQPEGDGLGSAENPLDPQVGDLRVTWRELVLPTLQGRVVLLDGTWSLPDSATSSPAGTVDASALDQSGSTKTMAWWAAGGLLLLLAAAGVVVQLRRRRRATASRH